MTKIRVMLVDDQMLIREGLTNLLNFSDSIEVYLQAEDGQHAIDLLQNEKAQRETDVILLDIQMPRVSGIGVLEYMLAQNIQIPTIILTTFDDHELILRAIKAGAQGYLLKDISFTSLTESIRAIHNGETVIQPAITDRLIKNTRSDTQNPELLADTLTEKEERILRLIASGFSNKEIAESLHNSEGTIKNQVSNILQKLNARDRTQAVLKALALNLFNESKEN